MGWCQLLPTNLHKARAAGTSPALVSLPLPERHRHVEAACVFRASYQDPSLQETHLCSVGKKYCTGKVPSDATEQVDDRDAMPSCQLL